MLIRYSYVESIFAIMNFMKPLRIIQEIEGTQSLDFNQNLFSIKGKCLMFCSYNIFSELHANESFNSYSILFNNFVAPF